jgi:carbamoyltransferase
MIVLGLNAYHGDAAAAILVDGRLVAAAEEERFTRVKHCAGFPAHAVRYCLQAAGVTLGEVDHVAVPRRRRARLLRKAWWALQMPHLAVERLRAWGRFGDLRETLALAVAVDPARLRAQFHFVEHHRAHLASAFFASPFERAAALSLDGFGDFASGLWGLGEGGRIAVWGGVGFPHSLGLAYTAVTQHLGFWKYGDEYKVMGLAAHGEPAHLEAFRRIVRTHAGPGYALDLAHFVHHRDGASMTWAEGEPVQDRLYSERFEQAFGPARPQGAELEPRHCDLAASLQARLEEAVVHQWLALHRLVTQRTGRAPEALAYAGGVAFNCVANGKIFESTPFERLYVPPAAGDAGLAVGAALHVWHEVLGRPRSFEMRHAYWGPEYGPAQVRAALEARWSDLQRAGARVREVPDEAELCRWTAGRIAEGKIVGWFQGRMEWGPRALGNRSILVDPRRPEMKDVLNRRIKHREPFRPFAPSILAERVGDYFEQTRPSPFMLMAYRVRPAKRAEIPAPTHVDGTGRLQTVDRESNPLYWRLLHEFERLTGVPVLLNTSFNENEPIVCTPEEALDCFLRTRMDVLVMGPYVVGSPDTPAPEGRRR